MNANLMNCELVERDTGPCGCRGGPTLAVLQDVQRAYEGQMEAVDKLPSSTKKLQAQVDILRSWVGDLVGQNSLLARAVEELEVEATSQLFRERRRHSEVVMELRAEQTTLRRQMARKDSDLRGLLEVLRRLREFDNCTLQGIHFFELTESDIFGSFEKEIRKLNKDAQQYEQTILSLSKEVSMAKYHTPDVSKRDASVLTDHCNSVPERGDWEPVQDFSPMREEMASYQERIQKMELNLKRSGSDVRSLRAANSMLREELVNVHSVCATLAHECRAQRSRDQFKDDIIREMRRQLKQAKDQSKEVADLLSRSGSLRMRDLCSESPRDLCRESPRGCVREQPRPSRAAAAPHSLSDDCRSPRLEHSAEDLTEMPD